MAGKKIIKVLVVDDSKLVRELLTQILNEDSSIEVVGTAVDPFDAREKIKQLNPDVITLDVEMPRMDGITFLKNLMRLRPMPVVMISTLTEKGAETTLDALELGAIDYIAKPKAALNERLLGQTDEIIQKVKYAAKADAKNLLGSAEHQQTIAAATVGEMNPRVQLIAIGASTGGIEATKAVLQQLPNKMPPIVISQHMPGSFTASYATRLDRSCHLNVSEFAQAEQRLEMGHVYLANGNYHMHIEKRFDGYYAVRDDSAPVNRHKPSVDVMFASVAEAAKGKAIGALLTGMGIDGANGLLMMREAGCKTIAQDEKSSVVWGMPRAAVELQAAEQVLAPQYIGKQLVKYCYNQLNQ